MRAWRNWTVIASLSLVFSCGVGVGTLGHWLYSTNTVVAAKKAQSKTPEDFRREYVAGMTKRLQLNQEQVEKLNAVLDYTRNQFRQMKERHKPEVKAIQQEQVDKINEFLTPPQQAAYEQMRKEREAKEKLKKQDAAKS